MIKGIFFDAGGIFYKREEPSRSFAVRLVKEQGYTTELTTEDEARLRTFKEQASNGWISAQDYWDEYLKMHAVGDPVKRTELVDKILTHVNTVVGLPGAHEAVKILKERGFILGVITSTMYPLEWKMSWLAAAGVVDYIDVIACSSAVGWDKDHPTIYWAALNKANVNPWQAAYVANGAKELAEAHQIGMATVAVLYDSDAKADYYVQSLPDLLTVPIFQV